MAGVCLGDGEAKLLFLARDALLAGRGRTVFFLDTAPLRCHIRGNVAVETQFFCMVRAHRAAALWIGQGHGRQGGDRAAASSPCSASQSGCTPLASQPRRTQSDAFLGPPLLTGPVEVRVATGKQLEGEWLADTARTSAACCVRRCCVCKTRRRFVSLSHRRTTKRTLRKHNTYCRPRSAAVSAASAHR